MQPFGKKPLFEKREQISRKEFKENLRRANPIVPGTGRKMFTAAERIKIEKKLFFGAKLDTSTSKDKYKTIVRRFGVTKYKTPMGPEREMVDKKMKFLKKLGGI